MPRYTQPRKTWQYTNEFKVKAGAQHQYLITIIDVFSRQILG